MENNAVQDGRPHVIIQVSEGRAVCPICGARTKQRVLPNTRVMNFPLFCPRCKMTSVVDSDVSKLNTTH